MINNNPSPVGSLSVSSPPVETMTMRGEYKGHVVSLVVTKEDYDKFSADGKANIRGIEEYVDQHLGKGLLDEMVKGFDSLKGVAGKSGEPGQKIVSALVYTPSDGKVWKKEGGHNVALSEKDFEEGKPAFDKFLQSIAKASALGKQHLPVSQHATPPATPKPQTPPSSMPPAQSHAAAPPISPPATPKAASVPGANVVIEADEQEDLEKELAEQEEEMTKLQNEITKCKALQDKYTTALAESKGQPPQDIKNLEDGFIANNGRLVGLEMKAVGLEKKNQETRQLLEDYNAIGKFEEKASSSSPMNESAQMELKSQIEQNAKEMQEIRAKLASVQGKAIPKEELVSKRDELMKEIVLNLPPSQRSELEDIFKSGVPAACYLKQDTDGTSTLQVALETEDKEFELAGQDLNALGDKLAELTKLNIEIREFEEESAAAIPKDTSSVAVTNEALPSEPPTKAKVVQDQPFSKQTLDTLDELLAMTRDAKPIPSSPPQKPPRSPKVLAATAKRQGKEESVPATEEERATARKEHEGKFGNVLGEMMKKAGGVDSAADADLSGDISDTESVDSASVNENRESDSDDSPDILKDVL